MSTVAFVGLGNMGAPMAANALKAGHQLRGHDISAQSLEAAARRGIAVSADLEEAVRDAEIVVTMLSAGPSVIEVWKRALPVMAPGGLIIDSSSINVESSRAAHALARSHGRRSLDAPVSGGVEGAEAATLTFMVGGEPDAYEAGLPFLQNLGRRVVYCGAAGSGVAAKICNNMILGISMIAVSEAFLLADGLGLSRQALFDVASSASGQCYALTTHCPVPGPVPTSAANNGYKPGFAAELMAKDLGLSQECARFSGAATPLGASATELYRRFIDADGRGVDYAGIINFLRIAKEQERNPFQQAGE